MRKALVVGINDYPTAPLHGCVADATRMSALLADNEGGRPNFDVRLLTTLPEIGTKALLRSRIEELFSGAADIALFYFSGHGLLNSTGGYFVTPDAKQYDEGVSMELVIGLANRCTSIRERVVIIDCCHAGAFGTSSVTSGTATVLEDGVSVLTAANRHEAAVEVGGQGLFTRLLCDGLEGGASDVRGRITTASLYSYVDEALGPWSQRPLFKTNVSRFSPLRESKPVVPLDLLRRIPALFTAPMTEFPLDPSYEPEAKPDHPEHEKIFGELQKLRNARLVEPIGADHMYFAAMESRSCRLTPLGRQYWRLATERKI